ncbi:hypothetical protein Ddc_03559 [Ditylenchus destructor]|nr:hypothetical protein Ddc_03559 [Ditylenchus destructor]
MKHVSRTRLTYSPATPPKARMGSHSSLLAVPKYPIWASFDPLLSGKWSGLPFPQPDALKPNTAATQSYPSRLSSSLPHSIHSFNVTMIFRYGA